MGRPTIQGMRERGGAPSDMTSEHARAARRGGLPSIVATNSELEFERYLRLGDRLHANDGVRVGVRRKATARGVGYFVTWVTTYFDDSDEVVGRQRFRVFKFKPAHATGATP